MSKSNDYYQDYSNYLQSISFKAKAYRNFFYFPILYKCLKGKKLEIGCGTGGFLEKFDDVVGIDINPNLIDICQSKNLNAHLMDIDKINFKNNYFDSVLIDNVIEHIVNPKNLLKEIFRVLDVNGVVVVSVPGEKGFHWDKDHKTYYNKIQLAKTFEENGFTKIKMFNTPFKSSWLDKNIRQYCLHGVFAKKVE